MRCCLSTVTLHYAPSRRVTLGYFSDAAATCASAQTREGSSAKLTPMRSLSLIRPSDLLVTDETLRVRKRSPHRRAETAAFDELALILGDDPHRARQRLTECVLRLCGAGSAGVGVLQPSSHGHADFVWEAVSGALAAHQGDGTPGDFGPCGLCLDVGTSVVLTRPERVFTYLARVQPSIVEMLIVPLYDDRGTPLGALWAAHHEPAARFHADDVRTIERLAAPMVQTLQRACAGSLRSIEQALMEPPR
ncbi:MAG TPA: GAF domain-containing protein [Steroidobacteraceae bacterium]|nr:GAF domain-containing protein [Steroidobacteraceae bacterium]